MKIAIVGSNGQVGKSLIRLLQSLKKDYVAFSKKELDITKNSPLHILKQHAPTIIINASAYTAVDLAEQEQDLAFCVNQQGVALLAHAAKSLHIPLLHLSTDYVFDGTSKIPYAETDATNPKSIYGHSKLNGETEVIQTLQKFIIIRTSWVFSEYGKNFFKTMYKLSDKNSLSIVNDQVGCPTYAGDIAITIVNIIDKIAQDSSFSNWGVYHYCGDHSVSWYEFAQVIFQIMKKQNPFKIIPSLKGITSHEYTTTANRPMFSSLSNAKIQKIFQVLPSNWKRGIKKCISVS